MHPLATLVARYWWAIVLRGVVALLLGLMAFVWPGLTLAALVLLFGAYALCDGVAAIILGFTEYGNRDRWWATLVGGLVSIAAGLITLFRPGVTAIALLFVIAAWAIVRGVFDIMAAIRLRHVIDGEWLLALSGGLSIGFGLLLVAFPGAGALAVLWWIGAYLMLLGAMLVVLGFRLRKLAVAAPA